jgi:tellurium resistance protein TerD
MALSLQKGGNLSLSKAAANLTNIVIGLGWDVRTTDGAAFDLDASLFMVGETGKVRSDADFIFYNQARSACGSVEHTGDNRTGAGDGDDESIKVNLVGVPANVSRLVVTVTIHDADARRQSFGQVGGAFMRIVNAADNSEIARFDLSEDYSTETAMIFGEVYRHGGEWKFKAVGQGYSGGLYAMCQQYGVNIG